MKKRTKIIATIGPSSQSEEVLKEIFKNGVDLARLNTKHNSLEWHKETARKIRKVSKELKKRIGIIIDLQGPEIRIAPLKNAIQVNPGDELFFSAKEDKKADIVIRRKEVINSFKKGQEFSIDDGLFRFKVKKIKKNGFLAECFSSGKLESRKSVNIPFLDVPLPSLREKDVRFIKEFGDEIDYFGLSFVRDKNDILNLRKEFEKINPTIGVISKIEKPEALENIDDIIEVSDAIMIARGDLAIEAGFEKIPVLQKKLILKSRRAGKPVIVATQMLDSMIQNRTPTRAEVGDVANAVFETADCLMLSGETAIGKYPKKTVEMMGGVIKEAEKEDLLGPSLFSPGELELNEKSVVQLAAILPGLVKKSDLPKGFLVFTKSGRTGFSLASFRPRTPIFAFTDSETVMDRLLLAYNITPFKMDFKNQETVREAIKKASSELKKRGEIEKGDKLVVISGEHVGVKGSTNSIRIWEVK